MHLQPGQHSCKSYICSERCPVYGLPELYGLPDLQVQEQLPKPPEPAAPAADAAAAQPAADGAAAAADTATAMDTDAAAASAPAAAADANGVAAAPEMAPEVADKLSKLRDILSGKTPIGLNLEFLYHHNKADLQVTNTGCQWCHLNQCATQEYVRSWGGLLCALIKTTQQTHFVMYLPLGRLRPKQHSNAAMLRRVKGLIHRSPVHQNHVAALPV